IDLGHDHAAALAAERLGAALAHLAEAAHHRHLTAQHDVGGAVEPVDQRVAAAVDVVELALGDRVVDVDGGEEERALLRHLVEACTPVVVSSLTPRTRRATRFHCPGASFCRRRRSARTTPHSSGSLAGLKAGTLPAFSNSTPLCTRSVASPPSSTMRSGPAPSGHTRASPSARSFTLKRGRAARAGATDVSFVVVLIEPTSAPGGAPEPACRAQVADAVGALPAEVRALGDAPEVAVGGGALVDGALQPEH